MKHTAIAIMLVVIEALVGLGALGGGIAILTGAFDQWLPIAWLQPDFCSKEEVDSQPR